MSSLGVLQQFNASTLKVSWDSTNNKVQVSGCPGCKPTPQIVDVTFSGIVSCLGCVKCDGADEWAKCLYDFAADINTSHELIRVPTADCYWRKDMWYDPEIEVHKYTDAACLTGESDYDTIYAVSIVLSWYQPANPSIWVGGFGNNQAQTYNIFTASFTPDSDCVNKSSVSNAYTGCYVGPLTTCRYTQIAYDGSVVIADG